MNLLKLIALKFIVGHPSSHSARRMSLSGVAESIMGSSIDSATPFHFAQNDNLSAKSVYRKIRLSREIGESDKT